MGILEKKMEPSIMGLYRVNPKTLNPLGFRVDSLLRPV